MRRSLLNCLQQPAHGRSLAPKGPTGVWIAGNLVHFVRHGDRSGSTTLDRAPASRLDGDFKYFITFEQVDKVLPFPGREFFLNGHVQHETGELVAMKHRVVGLFDRQLRARMYEDNRGEDIDLELCSAEMRLEETDGGVGFDAGIPELRATEREEPANSASSSSPTTASFLDRAIDFLGGENQGATGMHQDMVDALVSNGRIVDERESIGQRLEMMIEQLVVAGVARPLSNLLHADVEQHESEQHQEIRWQQEVGKQGQEQGSREHQESQQGNPLGIALALRDIGVVTNDHHRCGVNSGIFRRSNRPVTRETPAIRWEGESVTFGIRV